MNKHGKRSPTRLTEQLSLHRETLRFLAKPQLAAVAGASNPADNSLCYCHQPPLTSRC